MQNVPAAPWIAFLGDARFDASACVNDGNSGPSVCPTAGTIVSARHCSAQRLTLKLLSHTLFSKASIAKGTRAGKRRREITGGASSKREADKDAAGIDGESGEEKNVENKNTKIQQV